MIFYQIIKMNLRNRDVRISNNSREPGLSGNHYVLKEDNSRNQSIVDYNLTKSELPTSPPPALPPYPSPKVKI